MVKPSLSEISRYALSHPSAIREIMTIVTDYKLHPEKYPKPLIYLGGGWPQDPPPPILLEHYKRLGENREHFIESCRYGTTRGQPDFIESLVDYEKTVFDREIEDEEVVVGLGSSELTAAVFLATLDPGSEVVVTRPYYLNYLRQLEIELQRNVRVKYWNMIDEEGVFSPNLDELQNLVTHNTRLVILAIPGNPDSQILDDDVYEGVVDLAEEKGFWVLTDLAYRAFIYTDIPSYMRRKRRENELLMVSLSKELRIPGWRASYLVADTSVCKAVETIEQARTLCPSRLVQEILASIFSDKDNLKILREFNERSKVKYAQVASKTYQSLLQNLPETLALKPKGSFYVFFYIGKYMQSSKEFCDKLLKTEQVALAPGKDFGMEGWVRLSFAPVVEEPWLIDEAIHRMKEFIETIR
ncbi:MAG: pyridoxal phosphate-dependent aminotransferase [Thermoproteales archaeon]|nr:pyridoxal phosphate-dependent aminotransferase [Thermoproteales archaeon]